MSMRLQAKLLDKLSSHIEESYLRNEDTIVLHNVPAEMVFVANQGFIEHESQKHGYLPCYHMVGKITEVRGDFPFNISSVYFSAADDQRMTKDIIYYPTPAELAHIIQVGMFYTKHFQIPPILGENTYNLPCMVDLTIVPPPNQVAYETNLANNFADLEEEDKVNLPIVYIGILGTGVDRKHDKLLDYYGIDVEPGYSSFLLTAESSGYTDPPLLAYMQAPVIEAQEQRESTAQYYITPEEEAQMLHSQQEQRAREEKAAMAQVSIDAQADFHQASPEDAIIAQADRTIQRNMEAKFGNTRVMSLEAKREFDKQQASQMESEAEAEAETTDTVAEAESDKKLTEPDTKQEQAEVKMDVSTSDQNAYIEEAREEKNAEDEALLGEDHTETAKMAGADVEDAAEQTKVDEAHEKDIALDAAREKQQAAVATSETTQTTGEANASASKLGEPDMPEQRAEVKMDLSPEFNQQNQPTKFKEPTETKQTQDVMKADNFELEHKEGSDVSDARAQAKVDEARARDAARDTAIGKQQEHREAPESMKDIADKYDKSKSDAQAEDDAEYI